MNRFYVVWACLIWALSFSCSALSTVEQGVWYQQEASVEPPSFTQQMASFHEAPEDWLYRETPTVNLGLQKNAYWFIWPLASQDLGQSEQRIFSLQNSSLDIVNYWFLDAQLRVIKRGVTGDNLPHSTRGFREPGFSIEQPPKSRWLVTRIVNADAMAVTGRVQTRNAYLNAVRSQFLHFGLFAGVMLAMLIYNAFLSLRLKVAGIRSYCFWVFTILLNVAVSSGFAYRFLWPENPRLNQEIASIVSPLAGVACILLTIEILELRQKWSKQALAICCAFLAVPLALIVTAPMVDDAFTLAAGYKYLPMTIIVVFAMTLMRFKAGERKAKVLLFAWTIYLALGIPTALFRAGFDLDAYSVSLFLMVGAASLVFIFGLTLSLEARRIFSEKDAINKSLLETQAIDKALLDEKVQERTVYLRRANREMTVKRFTDSVTGLRNREFFQQSTARYLQSERKQGRDSALVLIDIDEFKRVNRDHGFSYGDTCLKTLAESLLTLLQKREKIICRYQANTYALLLSGLNTREVENLSETIREMVAAQPHNAHSRFTCSIGFSHFIASPSVQLNAVFQRARHALQQAKSNGGNSVACA